MLQETIQYLTTQKENIKLQKLFEILIVDDGSKDDTANYAVKLAYEFKLPPHQLRVIRFERNRGKGGAVTHGMQSARGSYIIFADADGASKFSDVSKLLKSITELDNNKPTENPAVVIGSRAHMVNTDAVVKRAFIRNVLMYGLHTLVFIFGIRDIKDTQCGFKLFNKAAVELIFPNMHTEGWIFDVEILLLAHRQNIKIEEIPINWHEVDGSKMVLARDSVNMAIDLIVTRMAYILGIYKERTSIDKQKYI
jgi:dolichyl-phosphate beta-glucosyltransferase